MVVDRFGTRDVLYIALEHVGVAQSQANGQRDDLGWVGRPVEFAMGDYCRYGARKRRKGVRWGRVGKVVEVQRKCACDKHDGQQWQHKQGVDGARLALMAPLK